ncbi:MAG TPA: sulfite exporter TauE/SafE family protein [Ohtaekwangia sp.]
MQTNTISLRSVARWYFIVAGSLLTLALLILFVLELFPFAGSEDSVSAFGNFFTTQFFLFTIAGFAAQMIDGALGMAYGVSSTTFLMSTGVPPAVASASVHISEVFTTGASGIAHWRFGNVDTKLLKKLVLPGALGAGLGAYVLSSFDASAIKPYISFYLVIMGIVIIIKALRKRVAFKEPKRVGWLALFGGFVDACGGGGWGPIVTTTLIGSGNHPRLTIGTVNAVEFFVALTASGIFTIFIGVDSWQVVTGLILGGVIAAPLGALITQRVNVKASMIFVGLLIIGLSIRTIVLALL